MKWLAVGDDEKTSQKWIMKNYHAVYDIIMIKI